MRYSQVCKIRSVCLLVCLHVISYHVDSDSISDTALVLYDECHKNIKKNVFMGFYQKILSTRCFACIVVSFRR